MSSPEEEIFGNLVVSDTSEADWWAILTPSNGLPQGSDTVVPINFIGDSASGGHWNAGADWGWYDVDAGDGPCRGVGSPIGKHIHQAGDSLFESPGDSVEIHCVEAGTLFTLDLILVEPQDDTTLIVRREIDYRKWVEIQGSGVKYFYPSDAGGTYNDIIVHYDDVNGADGPASDTVEVNIVADPSISTWLAADTAGDGKYHVPMNWHIRLGAWKTAAPSGSPYDTDDMLVRYFWHYPDSTSDRSSFIDVTTVLSWNLQVKQYDQSGVNRTILAQIVMPYEYPTHRTDMADVAYGALDTLDFYIDSAFTAVIDFPDTIWICSGNDTTFTDIGVNRSGSATWGWDFTGDGEADSTGISIDYTFS